MNSSAALFWLKQVCFNKGAGKDEERDRFEFMTGKVEGIPVPDDVKLAFELSELKTADQLTSMALNCRERGQRCPSLALQKLFEKAGEAYYDWNIKVPGYVAPYADQGQPFEDTSALRSAYQKTEIVRNRLRAEMIALQEEMDWLVYSAYGLLPKDHAAFEIHLRTRTSGVLRATAICALVRIQSKLRPCRKVDSRRLVGIPQETLASAPRGHSRQRTHPPNRTAGL